MKKIKFALEMEDGVKVRDLEQLRENFSIIKIYEHYQSGKLQSWLESRYYDEVLKAVQEIQCDEQSFYEKMCEILDTEIIESEQNVWKDFWMQMNRKKNKRDYINLLLKEEQGGSLIEIGDLDMIATNQEELDMLLEGENEKVYICTGEKLIIPVNKKAVTFIGINNPEVELENSDVKLFVENNIEFVGLKFKEKDYYTELKARKYFPESLKESYSLHTHKGKFYNGVFYGFTSDKIIICRDSENIEERDVVESLGNTQVNIIAIDADEQKIGILSYTNKNGYIVYELSRTDYAVEKKYDVHIHLQEAYQRNLQNKECTVSLNIKEKTVNLGLSLGHLVLEKDNFPQYLIINYETQEVKNNGYFSLSRGGRYKMKEYGNNIFLLSARDGKIFSSENEFGRISLYIDKTEGEV